MDTKKSFKYIKKDVLISFMNHIIKKIKESEKFIKYLENANIKKEIYVPNRLVNFVII